MYGYLLDGELASNYLSWQWIAGTFSHKPYVFNAENVQKYASWLSCTNTQIDRDYEALDDIARNQADLGPEAFITSTPVPVPELFYEPVHFKDVSTLDLSNKVQLDEAKNWARVQKNIRLINPWDLGKPHQGKSQVGVIDLRFHEKHPWSRQRWEFVLNGMHKVCEQIWVLNTTGIANTKQILKVTQSLGGHVSIDESLNPAYRGLPALLNIQGVPSETLLPEPPYFQQSFSKFYKKTTQMAGSLDALF
jgi:deoxyribodipyrimidine photo-lyase